MEIAITTPFTEETARTLKAGDCVLISGEILTGRDAAHDRLFELLAQGKPLPVEVENTIMYYVGPSPTKPGKAIGSAGPTTSYRMDAYAPALIEKGLRGMIGKGFRSAVVIQTMKTFGGVYFGAIGGAGALLAKCVEKAEVIAYEDLGTEAIHRLTVKDFPAVVVIDSEGNNLYETGRKEYLAWNAKNCER